MDNNKNNSSSDSNIDYILTENFVKMHNFAFFELEPILSIKPYKAIINETNITDEYINEYIIDVLI